MCFFVTYHLAHYFAPSHLVCLIALPDRVSTPPNQPSTTDSSSMVSVAPPPPEAYNALNYHFNHQLPTNAPFYRPDDILNHLTTCRVRQYPHSDCGSGTKLRRGLRGADLGGVSTTQPTADHANARPRLPTANPQPAIRLTNAPLRFTTLLLQLDVTTPHHIAHQLHGHRSISSPSRNLATLHHYLSLVHA